MMCMLVRLLRSKGIDTSDGMSDTDLLSHRLLEQQIEREDVNFSLKNYEMPVNQQNGVHTRLADLVNGMPFDSVPHYQDYISRLRQIPHDFLLALARNLAVAGKRRQGTFVSQVLAPCLELFWRLAELLAKLD